MKFTQIFFTALAISSPALSLANGFIVGELPATPAAGNCIPFGCASSIPEYQQVYSAASFSEAFSISTLTFYNTAPGYGQGQLPEGSFLIKLSTTSKSVDSLSQILSENVGTDEVLFAAFAGGFSAYPSFTIAGDPFSYDPSLGNLLMTVTATNITQPLGSASVFLNGRSADAGGVFSRVFVNNANFGGFEGYGLITGFNISAVPEPASALLLATGALLGFARCRRITVTSENDRYARRLGAINPLC